MSEEDNPENAVIELLRGNEGKLPAGDAVKELKDLLAGHSLKDVAEMPKTLHLEKQELAETTEMLVFENYTTFLKLAINISKTRKSVNETKVLQGSLQSDVKHLETACQSFAERASAIAEQREANRAMMQHYPQVLELLEVPQQIEVCIKSRSYDRALELVHAARTTLSQHRVPVLEGMGEQVKRLVALMREQILAQLASDCDMETTIRSVDYLRRLEAGECDELRLRQSFLVVREQWMENGKTALPSTELSRWLMGLAERLRTDLFYVVTQYQTLFSGDDVEGGANLLWSFTYRKVEEFVEVLRQKLPLVTDGEEIGAIMEQTMYCGSSLSRVGLDFRLLTHSLFEEAIRSMTRGRLEAALFFFTESLRMHDWRIDASAEGDEGDESFSTTSGTEALRPPASLLKHPPLALLTNDLLETLNHLRYCAVLTIGDELKALLRSTCSEATAVLHTWGKMPSDSKQKGVYNDLLKELLDSMIPHIEVCTKLIFMAPSKSEDSATVPAATSQ